MLTVTVYFKEGDPVTHNDVKCVDLDGNRLLLQFNPDPTGRQTSAYFPLSNLLYWVVFHS